MIITKTSFIMSFFGGGTDMPDFFNEYNGAVISTTFVVGLLIFNFMKGNFIFKKNLVIDDIILR